MQVFILIAVVPLTKEIILNNNNFQIKICYSHNLFKMIIFNKINLIIQIIKCRITLNKPHIFNNHNKIMRMFSRPRNNLANNLNNFILISNNLYNNSNIKCLKIRYNNSKDSNNNINNNIIINIHKCKLCNSSN